MDNYLFLVVEGTDGVGKSTLQAKLKEKLEEIGINCMLVTTGLREIDDAIYQIQNGSIYDKRAHFFLALANSIMTYNESIDKVKRNNEKTVIIFNRYFYTTIAYNVALGLDYDWCKSVTNALDKPHKVIFCCLPVAKAMERKKEYEEIETGFSSNQDRKKAFWEYQKKVSEVFDKIIEEDPDIFLKIQMNNFHSAIEQVLRYIESYFSNIKYNNRNEVEKLAEYLNMVPISKKVTEIGTYKSAVLICLDAVLSINRQYYKFVVPRIKYFMENCSGITTLNELYDAIINEGPQGFSKYWNYNHRQRYETLKALIEAFLIIKKNYPAESEIDSLRIWSNSVRAIDYKKFGVKGIGIATFQYLRLLLGASTVKPDVHIKRVVSKVIGREINDVDTILLFEEACKLINVPTKIMDRSLWLRMANNVDQEYEWIDNEWISRV